MIHQLILQAYKIMEGEEFPPEFFFELAGLEGEDVLDLLSLAHKVRNRFAGEDHVCSIMNAKSGLCPESCRFCAQSAHFSASIDTYPLVTVEKMMEEAKKAVQNGVKHFGIVTSGYGYLTNSAEFQTILNGITALRKTFPGLSIDASLGILSEDNVRALKEAGIRHYNINLQVNPEKYSELITDTHSVEQRVETIRYLKKYGIQVCSGGIIGVGESMADRVRLALTLKELEVDVVPLNVLIPIPGTPLEGREPVSAMEVAKTFAIFRLILKDKAIKFAAGRETVMKDWQGLILLSGANGFLTGGYLTTRGRAVDEDMRLQKELEYFSHVPNQIAADR